MSKSLVLGNGSLTVGFDQFAQVKDCYFYYVGLENQMGEQSVNRIGAWVNGEFSWFSDGTWEFEIDYKKESLVGETVARNKRLEIEIVITDVVYNEQPVLIRHFHVKNVSSSSKTVKLFLNHSFEMYRTPKGDTVYFDPNDNTIVHYKGRRVAVIAGLCGNEPFNDYSVGLSQIEGKEGTWRDSEDGILSKNSIEHGTVDSTISFSREIDANESVSIVNWISFAKTAKEAKALYQYALKRAPMRLSETTENFWRAWVNKGNTDFFDLDQKIIDLYKKSLLILRVHVGEEGEIVASVDSDMLQWGRDNYNYVWPRDGAYVAQALDHAGYSESARKFFEFCNEVISEEGYFFHKYRPDRAIGSSWHGWVNEDGNAQLPIQEDETASVLISLWNHYEYTHDLEFIEKVYNSLIKKAASFIVGFRGKNKLPYPTFDLWEMKMGTHTYTVGTVYKALLCAAEFASLLGKEFDEEMYKKTASEVKAASSVLWNESEKYFYKSVTDKNKEAVKDSLIDSSSFYSAWSNNLFESEVIAKAHKTLVNRLSSNEGVGGYIRFENDLYFRDKDSSKGNPWIVTTLWQTQYKLSIAKTKEELSETKNDLSWVVSHALRSGILSEQINPVSGFQLSASPLAWSHAEFITTVATYLKTYKKINN